MAKKGVYKISGNTTPKTGVKTFYNIDKWYPETPISDRNPAKVTWELFVKGDNGFVSTNIIKKGVNHFTFGKNAYKFTYKVEGYLHRPEGSEPMSIIVQPIQNDERPQPKEKDILGINLTYQDGSKITKPLSYKDHLMATAKCEGLEGYTITFTLWEDDETKSGHHTRNQFITKSLPIAVDKFGKARWMFSLSPTFISLASKREDDRKKHEYYVTAEYNGKIDASQNVNVNNPDAQASKPPPPPSRKPTPKKPKQDTPKASTNPASKNNQTDKKGNITKVQLLNAKGKAFTSTPKFGEYIRVVIDGKDLVGKKYNLRLWEDDNMGKNDLLYNEIHTFKTDRQEVVMYLKDDFRKTGEIGNNPKNPDDGEYYFTGNHQEIFAEVVFLYISTKSSIINVDLNTEPKKPESTKSPAVKKKTETEETKNDSACPRCTKLTESELKSVFPNLTDSGLIAEIVNSFNQYCKNFKVNTCALKAHFFAQAKQESGSSLKPAVNGESMDYGIPGLKVTGFLNVSTSYKFGNKNGVEMANELGRKKGESSLNIDRQIKIANFVYGLNPKAKTLGNRAPADNKSLSETDNEGWRYRGRGMLQITGRANYTDIEAHVNKVLGKQIINIKDGRRYDNKFTPTEALLSGLGDWDLKKMYIPAKVGVTESACLNVIKIINSKTKSKTKRVANLIGGTWYQDDDRSTTAREVKEKDSMKTIFRVKECKLLNPVDDEVKSNDSSVLEEMKKLVDKHIPYSQEGVRNKLDEEGLKNLDCSETVGIYLHKLGVMPTYKAIDTSTMTTQKNFRNTIGTENIDLVSGSEKSDFKPQRGDIFVWRKGSAGPGHTGIVYHYDAAKDIVTILEAIGSVGAVSESDQVKNGGYSGKGCSRTAKYSRLKGALYGHKGWAGYFRPKNYTKKL